MKPFKVPIGKVLKTNEIEFGEIYHTVIWRFLDNNYCPEFVEFDSGKNFAELYGQLPCTSKLDRNGHILQHSANCIFEHFHPGIQEALWGRISELASNEKWEETLPEELTKGFNEGNKLLLWIRNKPTHATHRNTSADSVSQLLKLCTKNDTELLTIGPDIEGMPSGCNKLGEYYTQDWFKSSHSIAKQLWFLNHLHEKHGVLGSVGMMSGAMDGLAMFCGRKVVYIAQRSDVVPRMLKVSSAVPNLEWVESFYSGNFKRLSDFELSDIERRIWGDNH